ncbi:GerMN domain-containing protein [Paenibacillus vini]|uniref:GerMN domain-containing protein n=1 Tax=Paenibacillus vini TaxID=1476024 RepID=UPI0025B693F3|nr:GerMN domain-containing protein [Paenibacillus vini]MDN4069132.1 GerMN domain-containing protein [Paenibacillus vini]
MNRKLYITGVIVLLLALSTGCGQKPGTSSPVDNSAEGNVQGTTTTTDTTTAAGLAEGGNGTDAGTGEQVPTVQTVTKTIETYYTDDEMLELTKSSVEIKYTEEQEKYLAALQTLKGSADTALFALWKNVEFHSAKLENGQLTIDITLPDEARLGAGGEVLALDALKQTMFQFDEVKSIELLVDGKQRDTLMGHEELEHPMTRN